MEERTFEAIQDQLYLFKNFKSTKYKIKEVFKNRQDEYELFNLLMEIDDNTIIMYDILGEIRKRHYSVLNRYLRSEVQIIDDWDDTYKLKLTFPDGEVLITAYVD